METPWHHNGRNKARRVRRSGVIRLQKMVKDGASDGAGTGESSSDGSTGAGGPVGALLGGTSGAGGLTATIKKT